MYIACERDARLLIPCWLLAFTAAAAAETRCTLYERDVRLIGRSHVESLAACAQYHALYLV